ncbi:hypothetical protein Celal_2495 [Cellulophaga algicola DSM 14237]|uniref:Secretion system C-terminal sorting domain-containing protein n=1 Tax=Cellulophaga algicola (strain DSM 14237 / IC166 / ACAM 630) TaxID=688270 RepID=E6X912_CELAD|nr:hypothetical protein [Cellulophaga algicola]ADV49783.1 hypothetical protein Celal_2495 [Cellulophaga algicola DSM 14237]
MRVLITLIILLFCLQINAQELTEKVLFVKPQPVKILISDSYDFTIGYIALADGDLSIDISGGPSKYYATTKIKIKKGQGIQKLTITSAQKPSPGKGYKLVLSLRAVNGNWETTRVGQIINNIEFIKKPVSFSENASFSPLLNTIIENTAKYQFDVDYSFSKPMQVQIALWQKNNWLASSKRIAIGAGSGSKKIAINYEEPLVGKDYRLVLSFGLPEDFTAKNTITKEISGVQFLKPTAQITMAEINNKSIQISVNKSSNILTLPGSSAFDFIKIIDRNGKIILEELNSKHITISTLSKGAYFAITSTNDYYKFVKF